MDQNRFGLPFDMVLQLGTLGAVVWFYRLYVFVAAAVVAGLLLLGA